MDDYNDYSIPFMENEDEVREAFELLDLKKNGYISTDELSFFLELIGENVNEEELEEMVRLLDVEGSNRVRFEEFSKLCLG